MGSGDGLSHFGPNPYLIQYWLRADSRFVPSQWETALLCNDVSHWLGTNLESALWFKLSFGPLVRMNFCDIWAKTQKISLKQMHLKRFYTKNVHHLSTDCVNLEVTCFLWNWWLKYSSQLPDWKAQCLLMTWALFQYLIRCLIVRSFKVSKPWDLYLERSDRSEIWQAHRRCSNLNYQSHGFETSRDHKILHLIGYWNGPCMHCPGFPDLENSCTPLLFMCEHSSLLVAQLTLTINSALQCNTILNG